MIDGMYSKGLANQNFVLQPSRILSDRSNVVNAVLRLKRRDLW